MKIFSLNQSLRKTFSYLILPVIIFGFTLLHPTNPIVFASVTKTLKACHNCDTLIPETTATSTPDACALDCVDIETTPFQSEDTPIADPDNLTKEDGFSVIFYWMQGCAHCEEVMKNTLPLIEQEFGASISIKKIELKTLEEINQLFVIGERFGIPKEQIGVPFIIVGEQAITGEVDVSQQLPLLIRAALTPEKTPIPGPSASKPAVSQPLLIILGGILFGLTIVGIFFLRKRRG